MSNKPKYYRICSCGTKIGSRTHSSLRLHRKMGHTIPMQRYDVNTGKKVKPKKG